MDFQVETPAGPVPARIEGEGEPAVLLATGAGTGQDHPAMVGLRTRLAARAMTVMTFEYAYRAAGRSFPDRPDRLLEVHAAASSHLHRETGSVPVLAGRSMGGRMATMLAARGEPCLAVVAYGYPLHPVGKPERLRIEHLGEVSVPLLLISGTRDALARSDLVERHLVPLPTATVTLVEDADHSFRRKGTSPADMLDHLADTTEQWLRGLPGLGESPRTRP